ncbi:replication-relaxation family protein [Streptomyces sp. NBC_01622]|uniref:replication-relaxation family protein n=1 Tax=Streptomyces sp. NBC_01622 TaxID=2975903 RepID=UPI003864EE80|nr:replication-relaxation family protein [Streptomyces sp. NBC_01622]
MDEEILRAINRLQYMTAAQIGRLLYPQAHDQNRYVQRRLRSLTEAGYLLRLRELPAPRIGSAPHVFTLADKGRRFVAGRGDILASSYYRPSEERAKAEDNPFMEHTLAAVDVLVAAERLCRKFQVSLPRLLNERQLKRSSIRVQPVGRPEAPRMAVIPDAWFQLTAVGCDPVSIALELDRGTEGQKHWRRKVASLTAWAEGPYRRAFETDNLTVAVAVPTMARRVQLSEWTAQELESIGRDQLADIFLFTDASPVATDPFELFFDLLWYPAGQDHPVSLLDAPESAEEEVSVGPLDSPRYNYNLSNGVEREAE